MKKLNLVDPDKSDVKYKISRFPDGQQTVDLEYIELDHVLIYTRLNSFKDLEILICATQALRNLNVENIEVYIPYFLGARSDRKFQVGGVNYLKQVICPIINSQNYISVTTVDPHSDVLEACLNNYNKLDNYNLVKFALKEIDNTDGAQNRICLVSPDAGAYKKIFDVAKKFRIDNIITANKVRDLKTGNVTRTEIPTIDAHEENTKYVIIDDICDGGRTFVELAKAIKVNRPKAKIYLVVTHGIFSAGFDTLNEYFEKIYTSNSFQDLSIPYNDKVKVYNFFY
jgi:ribose-phosphate pyrophosphokinase